MCRLAAYAGPPAPLSTLLYDPPRSLQVLSYQPRELLYGHVNVDGTGVAWWEGQDPAPLRYATPTPAWSDPNLPGLAPRLHGRVQIAAVRGATPGIPFGPANVAPFVHDGVAMAHNGWIGEFRRGTGRALAGALPDDLYGAMSAVSDSIVLFHTILAHRRADLDLVAATAAAIGDVAKVVEAHGTQSTLNVAISDGTTLVASRASVRDDCNSLYLAEGARRWPDAVVLASEPLDDDPAWRAVPEHHLVRVDTASLDVAYVPAPTHPDEREGTS